MLKARKHIHFIGIGGAGMSALAEVAVHNGFRVSGSDRQKSGVCERLESLGISIQYDHTPNLIKQSSLAVYTSAVNENNPERAYASDNGIPTMRRAEMLGELMRAKFSIGVSGTHGKTTTTSLIGHVLTVAGFDPSIIVGGTLRTRNTNAVIGNGSVLVAEADEYDRSFLAMFPSVAVVTNIEADHLDCYRDIEDIAATFLSYINRTPFYGAAIVCADDQGIRDILPKIANTVITYGTLADCDYRAYSIEYKSGLSSFAVEHEGRALGRVEVPIGGLHNVQNAMAAIAVAIEMSVPFDTIARGLSDFGGVKRRFEIIGKRNGVVVVDDYAHHPSEIAATISAARASGYKRVVAVFQPHLYSRTRDFLSDFATSLGKADIKVVTGIYRARETDTLGVSGKDIADEMKSKGMNEVSFAETKEQAVELVLPKLKDGDALVFMGAGDIGDMAPVLLERMSNA